MCLAGAPEPDFVGCGALFLLPPPKGHQMQAEHAELARAIAAELARHLRENPPVPLDWMDPGEAAKYVRLKPRALEDMRAQERGPRFVKVGSRIVRYRREWLDEWLLENSK